MNPQGLPGQIGADRGPVSRVELRIECKGLVKKDEFSKSDPCAALYMLSRKSQKWEEVAHSLVLMFNLININKGSLSYTGITSFF